MAKVHIEKEKRKKKLAIDSFKRGAELDGCVSCIIFLCQLQHGPNKVHLSLPWMLECAIRGNVPEMERLFVLYNNQSKPAKSLALSSFWEKLFIEIGITNDSEEWRKQKKKIVANICIVCGKKDSENITLVKCGICKHYSYCGKACQLYHWKTGNHIAECRQVMILRKYFKPRYAQEIREALVRGDDPTTIERLQTLRTAL